MAYRIESGRLDRASRTPSGGLKIPAAIGRTGILEYAKADGGTWREYRPPEAAFDAHSLDSLRGAPVTDLHPPAPVTPETYQRVSRGHVGDDARQDNDGRHVAASIYVADAELIRKIDAGERQELSAGYEVDLDLTPGVTPEGERYDAVQTAIRYNHVAVGPAGWGRAGPSVALRLDGDLNAVTDPAPDAGHEEKRIMKTERIDGVDYEVGSEAWAQARAKYDAARDLRLSELETKLATETARADGAEAERDKAAGRADSLEADAAKAADPATIDALVAERVSLVERARSLKPDVKTDGLTPREIMVAALAIDLDSKSDDYVAARFDAAAEQSDRVHGSIRDARTVATLNTDGGFDELEAAQARHIARNRDGWKGAN